MRFFVPLSNDLDDGERLYETIRNRLKQIKETLVERRIYVLKFHEEGKRCTIAVGDDPQQSINGPVVSHFPGWRHIDVLTFAPRSMARSKVSPTRSQVTQLSE